MIPSFSLTLSLFLIGILYLWPRVSLYRTSHLLNQISQWLCFLGAWFFIEHNKNILASLSLAIMGGIIFCVFYVSYKSTESAYFHRKDLIHSSMWRLSFLELYIVMILHQYEVEITYTQKMVVLTLVGISMLVCLVRLLAVSDVSIKLRSIEYALRLMIMAHFVCEPEQHMVLSSQMLLLGFTLSVFDALALTVKKQREQKRLGPQAQKLYALAALMMGGFPMAFNFISEDFWFHDLLELSPFILPLFLLSIALLGVGLHHLYLILFCKQSSFHDEELVQSQRQQEDWHFRPHFYVFLLPLYGYVSFSVLFLLFFHIRLHD